MINPLQQALLNRMRKAPTWQGTHDAPPMPSGQMNPPIRPNPVPQVNVPPMMPSPQMPGASTPVAPTGLPAPPPNPQQHLPPAWQRYATGLKMQQAYANNSTPNPAIVRVMGNQ